MKNTYLVFGVGCIIGVCVGFLCFIFTKHPMEKTLDPASTVYSDEYLTHEEYLKNGWGAVYKGAKLPEFVHVGQVMKIFSASDTLFETDGSRYIYAMTYPPQAVPDTGVFWGGLLRYNTEQQIWDPVLRLFSQANFPVYIIDATRQNEKWSLRVQLRPSHSSEEVFSIDLEQVSEKYPYLLEPVRCIKEGVDESANVVRVQTVKKESIFLDPESRRVIPECGYVYVEKYN